MACAFQLQAAAQLLLTHGWCQGAHVDQVGRLCVEGAIERCARDGDERELMRSYVRSAG